MEMTPQHGPVVLINVFTVEPARQQELVDLLILATDGFVLHARGFLGSTLHRSLDGTKVTMVARWRSAEDYQAMRGGREQTRLLERALTLARFEPGMYEVVKEFTPDE